MGHLRFLVPSPQKAVVDINGQLEVLTPANQAVHILNAKNGAGMQSSLATLKKSVLPE